MTRLLLVAVVFALATGAAVQRADPNFLAAEDYLGRGEYAKALEALELMARVKTPHDPEVFVMMAVARLNMDDQAGAVKACERGLDEFPASARLAEYYTALLADAPPGERAAAFDKALSRWPRAAVIRKALGKALLDLRGEPARAGALLSQARSELPRDPEAHYLYGRWACIERKEALCVDALTQSLALTPPGNYAAIALASGTVGIAEDRLGQSAKARAAFERAQAAWRHLEPAPPEAAWPYVRFLLDQNDKTAARTVTAEILARSPAFAPALLEEARFLMSDGRREQAAERAEQALVNCGPDKAQERAIRSLLVRIYTALGREADARRHQEWVDANQ